MDASDPGLELKIENVPTHINEWTVTREVAKILHSDDFGSVVEGRLLNFSVKLKTNETGGLRNDGTGTLTLPTQKSGHKFLKFVHAEPIKIEGRKLRFYVSGRPPTKKQLQTLLKTPFVDPDIEEQHQDTLRALEGEFRVDFVQFGVYYRESYPAKSRSFSIEWEGNYITSYASLSFEYDHKLILLKLGSLLEDPVGYHIGIRYSSIQRIAVGLDGRPYICFETLTPPFLEEVEIHRRLTGDREKDKRNYKYRVGFLDEGHRMVSPYAPHLRVELFNDPTSIEKFVTMCEKFGIARSIIIRFPSHCPLLAVKKGFFSHKRLHKLRKSFVSLPWSITFQLEALLLNGLLNTGDLEELIPLVLSLIQKHTKNDPGYVAIFLKHYHQSLKIRKSTDTPIDCFHERLRNFRYSEFQPTVDMGCYHVTFTPTRILLEGPYATQSNRVLREYQGHEDHFIRVDFRDEDMLQFRWEREVDGTYFLNARVGGTLKEGFELAGRRFEFLAYSNSALREHSVWFMNPFKHPSHMGWVDGAFIRDSLGDFKGDALLKQPSKFAARLAQAFTATDASAEIQRCEWEEVEDLVCPNRSYLFTDGVGTISRDLARRMWRKYSEARHITKFTVEPSAFQIRFLGFKGVVSVDDELDKTGNGIHMRLRPSMKKFTKEVESADVEIAEAFGQPNIAYLNRPLVMLLEDVGVRKETFLTLQHSAVASARTIDESLEKFESIISEHKMGTAFELREVLEHLRTPYKMDLNSMDNSFFRKLRRVATTGILRDIKHHARIPISRSYVLVGVADEGPAYERRGEKDVFCLNEGEVFACIQNSPSSEPEWLEGNASISRSPVAHMGDVQRIRLIGKPPDGVFCAFRNLRNVVVMPSRGYRSLASCLGGGDLDGDKFAVIYEETLLPTRMVEPATYDSAGTFTLDRECTVEDICDFVAEYINSDVVGLLSNRLLTIADQSPEGMKDEACGRLAELCSQAVDYPKQGKRVNLDDSLPRPLIRLKPDWHAAEVVSPRKTDFYESSRALGYMFRAIQLEDQERAPEVPPCTNPMSDSITFALFQNVQRYLDAAAYIQEIPGEVFDIFKKYQDELDYICATHTLSNASETKLLEEEVVIGTILAKCSQKRWRSNRIFRMKHHVGTLIKDIKRTLRDLVGFDEKVGSASGRVRLLELAWRAWNFSVYKREEFGANSFGLIALSVIFDCLDRLELSVLA